MSNIFDIDSYSFVGVLGAAFFFIFLVICIWRWLIVYPLRHKVNRFKLLFHLVLLCSIFLQVLYYCLLAALDRNTTVAYSFHLVALTLNIGAFFCLILFWSSSIDFGGSFDRVFPLICGLYTIDVLGLVTIIVILNLFSRYPLAGYGMGIYALLNAIVLLCGTVWLLVCGVRLQMRLNNYMRTSRDTRASVAKNTELRSLNLMLGVCSICFFARSVFLIAIFMWDMNVQDNNTSNTISGWFLITEWLPLMTPDAIFLYLMRVKTTSSGTSSTSDIPGVTGDYDDRPTELFSISETENPIKQIDLRPSLASVGDVSLKNVHNHGIDNIANRNSENRESSIFGGWRTNNVRDRESDYEESSPWG